MNGTIDQLIDDIKAINENENVSLPYNLHAFIRELERNGQLVRFETFLREYRSSRNPHEL